MYKQFLNLFEEGKFKLLYDRGSRNLVISDKRGNFYDMCGGFPNRFYKYFPKLRNEYQMHKVVVKLSRERWRERYKADHPDRCFERAVGII